MTDLDQTYVDNNSDARLGEFDPRMLYTTHIHKYQHNGYDDGWTINRHVGNWHYHLVSSFGHVLYRMIYCSEVTKLLIDNIKIKTIEFDRPVEYKQYKPGEAIERKRIPIRKLKLAFITFNVAHWDRVPHVLQNETNLQYFELLLLGGNDPNIAAMEDAAIMIERDCRAGNKDPKSTNNVFHMSVNDNNSTAMDTSYKFC